MRAKLVGVGFSLVGAFFLVIGIYFTYARLGFLGRCSEAKAVVVDIYWEEDYDPETGHYMVAFPVFQFTDQRTGEQVTARSSVGGPSPAYSVGQEVDILYDPQNPTANVLVESFWDLWMPSVLSLPVGSLLVIVGAHNKKIHLGFARA